MKRKVFLGLLAVIPFVGLLIKPKSLPFDFERAKRDFPYFCEHVLGTKPRSPGWSMWAADKMWEQMPRIVMTLNPTWRIREWQ